MAAFRHFSQETQLACYLKRCSPTLPLSLSFKPKKSFWWITTKASTSVSPSSRFLSSCDRRIVQSTISSGFEEIWEFRGSTDNRESELLIWNCLRLWAGGSSHSAAFFLPLWSGGQLVRAGLPGVYRTCSTSTSIIVTTREPLLQGSAVVDDRNLSIFIAI